MNRKLPTVKKNIAKSLTGLEKTKKVLVGAALASGLVAAGGLPVDSHAQTPSGVHETVSIGSGGILLTHPSASNDVVAGHVSHSSHSSHYSHYSSRS